MNAKQSTCHQAYHLLGFPHQTCGILFEDNVANVVDSKLTTTTGESSYIDNRVNDLKRLILDGEEGLRLRYTERRALSCGTIRVYFIFKAPNDVSAKLVATNVSVFLNEVCSREESPFFLYAQDQETYMVIFYDFFVNLSKLQAIYTPIQKRFKEIFDIKHHAFVADFKPYGTVAIDRCNRCSAQFPLFLSCASCSGVGYLTSDPILSTIFRSSGSETAEEYKLDSPETIREFVACTTMTHRTVSHVKLQQTMEVKIRSVKDEHLFLNFELQDLLENIMAKISPVYSNLVIAKLYQKRPSSRNRGTKKARSKVSKIQLIFVPERKTVCNPQSPAAFRTEHTVYFQFRFQDQKIEAVCKECKKTSEIQTCTKFIMRDVVRLCKSA